LRSIYQPSGNEVRQFRLAFAARVPLMLTGPTGCGKTRLVEHMAAELGRPLVTVTCHDDLTTADLLGRFLVQGGEVRWIDGPLTQAVRQGAVCYLDEVIEARRDTLAALHSLGDHRRTLYLDRISEELSAPPEFMLVCSYNPRARGAFKELKPSFRQRFVTIALDYLPPEVEAGVVADETGVSALVATRLVRYATAMRSCADATIGEAPSTRSLVTTAALIAQGLDESEAIDIGLLAPLSPSQPIEAALRELIDAGTDG
jgi:nitric oxide reductase NorQ protein